MLWHLRYGICNMQSNHCSDILCEMAKNTSFVPANGSNKFIIFSLIQPEWNRKDFFRIKPPFSIESTHTKIGAKSTPFSRHVCILVLFLHPKDGVKMAHVRLQCKPHQTHAICTLPLLWRNGAHITCGWRGYSANFSVESMTYLIRFDYTPFLITR